MPSLKTNIVLNFINTLTGIIFPIITFPYAARILQPEGIGTINFLQSIVNYIILLTSIGIPMYAVREVARHRDNIEQRNQTTVEILLLSLLLCIPGYIAVWLMNTFIPQIGIQTEVFYILSLAILFTSLGINWFYQAVEDFKFITIRAIIFRIVCAAFLFICVRTPDDLTAYAWILVGSTVGNNFINFVHLRKFIPARQITWKKLQLKKHLKPALHIFILNIVISLYTNLNTIMLGFMQDDTAVGYYTAGNKISFIALNIIGSLGTVMLPRCANLIETGQTKEFASVTQKAYHLVWGFSLPCLCGLILLASSVITIFCGTEFTDAIPVLCWTAPIILFIGLSNVIGIQILYPQGKENIIIWSTAGGAIFNLLLNIWLIPAYSYIGAGISTFIAELAVLIIQFTGGRKYIPFPLFERALWNYAGASLIMGLTVFAVMSFISDAWIKITIGTLLGGSLYMAILYLRQDQLLKDVFLYIKKSLQYNK